MENVWKFWKTVIELDAMAVFGKFVILFAGWNKKKFLWSKFYQITSIIYEIQVIGIFKCKWWKVLQLGR